jgi:hypothetical protein
MIRPTGKSRTASTEMINRRVEYLSATIMVGWAGLLTASNDNSVTSSLAFGPMIKRGWTEPQLAIILGLFGMVWLAALWINGHYRRTPVFRCICAGGGTVMWSHVAVMLSISGFEAGVWSTGVPVYWTLAIFDLASCYRSAADAYFAHIKGKIKDKMAAAQHES